MAPDNTNDRAVSRRDILKTASALPLAGLLPAAEAATVPNGGSEMNVKPFKIAVPQARLDWIAQRVKEAEWPDVPDGQPWQYGTSAAAMKDLVQYWQTRYDWRAREAAMNRFPHFKAQVEDYEIHFMHVKGSGKSPQPIIIAHDWPGSFVEFLKVIEHLARP